MLTAIPVLLSLDVPATVSFYTTKLRFTCIYQEGAEYSRQGVIHPNRKLEDTEYGTREFGVVDLHGVLITFFETG